MKRTYRKPSLYVETFELVEHIASCATNTGTYTVNSNTAWSCAATDGSGDVVFMEGTSKCEVAGGQAFDPNIEDIDDIISAILEGQCYNTYANGPMFSS